MRLTALEASRAMAYYAATSSRLWILRDHRRRPLRFLIWGRYIFITMALSGRGSSGFPTPSVLSIIVWLPLAPVVDLFRASTYLAGYL